MAQDTPEVAMTEKPKKMKSVFKATYASIQYFFKNGKQAAFLNYRYITDIESEIAELKEEIKSGHPHIYIDENEAEIDANALTPLEQLKETLRKELLAEMKASVDPTNDMGTTGAFDPKAGMTNSQTVAETAAGSSSVASKSK